MKKSRLAPSPRSQCKRCDGWVPVGNKRQHLLKHHTDNPKIVRQARDMESEYYLNWFELIKED